MADAKDSESIPETCFAVKQIGGDATDAKDDIGEEEDDAINCVFSVYLTRSTGGHFGIWLITKDTRVVVAKVDKHLSGEYAGVNPGDILRKVNDTDIRKMKYEKVISLIRNSRETSDCTLTFEPATKFSAFDD